MKTYGLLQTHELITLPQTEGGALDYTPLCPPGRHWLEDPRAPWNRSGAGETSVEDHPDLLWQPPAVVELVKLPEPEHDAATQRCVPELNWFSDRVERDWIIVPRPPAPVPVSITARQLRLWLVTHSLLAPAEAVIAAIPDETERLLAQTEWEYATVIERAHPLTAQVATAIGLNEAQLDQTFREAALL